MAGQNTNGVVGTVLDAAPLQDFPFLIVGMGPAGASLACFLASQGMRGLIINSASSTADTPRAHITNMAALECLRDIDLEDECVKAGNGGDCMLHTRWCYSMAGEEYARVYSWGSDPRRKGDYELASPCKPMDLPQTLLEPILVRYASQHKFEVRFCTSYVSFEKDSAGMFVSTLYDGVLKCKYRVRSKYLFGADGARSKIITDLGIPLISKPGKGIAINVLIRADLSNLIKTRMGNLHFILQPDRPHPLFGWLCIARMVKPWYEWMFILFPHKMPWVEKPTDEEYLDHIRELIGDKDMPVNILGVSKWYINETVAESYSEGNAFCLGDAVHRHPPMNGLGSNTCIQDAYNLAWKLAYVEKGLASPSLLESYSVERQPVGLSIVTRANRAFGHQNDVWEAMGLLSSDVKAREAALDELKAATPAGAARRKVFRHALETTRHEFHGLGVEMGQYYENSDAIYTFDEMVNGLSDKSLSLLDEAEDPFGSTRVLTYTPSTIPGRRLPHAWLNTATPNKDPISTQDLAGKGAFCLFTGASGGLWLKAAKNIRDDIQLPFNAYSIGFGQDWEDVYNEWERVKGVEESGCVLVRPDRFVCWRCPSVLEDERQCTEKLKRVLNAVLRREVEH